MKVYTVADIHGAQYRMNIILDHIKEYKPDLVVICGDITDFGPPDLALNLLNQIPVETLAVRGNCDPLEVNQAIDDSNATNARLQKIEKKGVTLVGCDFIGKVHHPTLDDETRAFLQKTVDQKSVLISHIPPFELQDMVFMGRHGGNKDIRSIVDTNHPRLVLCGHIHENPGVMYHDTTTVVNCSMGKRTEGALIEINDELSVQILT